MIFLHGLFASLQNWQTIVKRVSHQYCIINCDLPNHGSSPHTPKFDFQECVDAILKLMDDLDLQTCKFVGHSLGGKIGMLTAMQAPERITGLLIEDIAPKAYPPWFSVAMRSMQELNLFQIKNRKEADCELSKNIPDPQLRAFLLTNLSRSEHGFKWRVNIDALIAGGPNISGFPQTDLSYEGPTKFVCGTDSPYVKEEDFPLIQQYFPKAQIKFIDQADHWVHARQPDLFTEHLVQFLN